MKKLLFVFLISILISCDTDESLSDSIFIPDPDFPQLPAYSEWGYNTFGARFEREIFIYNNDQIPLKAIVKNKNLTLIFQGQEGRYSGSMLNLSFNIPNSNVVQFWDFLSFTDKKIDLLGDGIVVELETNQKTQNLKIISGELYFKRAQKILLDDVPDEVVLSGYFNLKFLINGVPSTMSDGRFDLGVNDDNFYNLD